jgi:hypothetical protein
MAHLYGLLPWDMTRLKRPELRALLKYADEMRAQDG